MNDDLLVSWNAVSLDIGGQSANILGYKVWDMADSLVPVEVADVSVLTATLVDFVSDPNSPRPIAVSAYNAQGDGARSATVIASAPNPSVPEAVQGVTAVIIPK